MTTSETKDGILLDAHGNPEECHFCGGKMELCPHPDNPRGDAKTHCLNCGVWHDRVDCTFRCDGIEISVIAGRAKFSGLYDSFKFARSLDRKRREELTSGLIMCDYRIKKIVEQSNKQGA